MDNTDDLAVKKPNDVPLDPMIWVANGQGGLGALYRARKEAKRSWKARDVRSRGLRRQPSRRGRARMRALRREARAGQAGEERAPAWGWGRSDARVASRPTRTQRRARGERAYARAPTPANKDAARDARVR